LRRETTRNLERIAKRLLATECDPDQRNHAGQTPAMYAALFQRGALLQALRERGADLEASDPMGNKVESLARGEIRTR
jgi:ankyrin repeat protein